MTLFVVYGNIETADNVQIFYMRQCWNRQTGTFEGRVRERTGSSPVCRIKTLEYAIKLILRSFIFRP